MARPRSGPRRTARAVLTKKVEIPIEEIKRLEEKYGSMTLSDRISENRVKGNLVSVSNIENN